MIDEAINNAQQMDQALARMIRRLQEVLRQASRHQSRARTLEPGSRKLQRMSTGELAREHITRMRREDTDYPAEQRQQIAAEFDRRGYPEAAAAVTAGLAGGAALANAADPADWTTQMQAVLEDAENPAYPASLVDKNVESAVDEQMANSPELAENEAEVVNSDPMTQEDFLADMAEQGIAPEVIENFDIAAEHAPNDLSEAIEQQHAQESPASEAAETNETAAIDIDQSGLEL